MRPSAFKIVLVLALWQLLALAALHFAGLARADCEGQLAWHREGQAGQSPPYYDNYSAEALAGFERDLIREKHLVQQVWRWAIGLSVGLTLCWALVSMRWRPARSAYDGAALSAFAVALPFALFCLDMQWERFFTVGSNEARGQLYLIAFSVLPVLHYGAYVLNGKELAKNWHQSAWLSHLSLALAAISLLLAFFAHVIAASDFPGGHWG